MTHYPIFDRDGELDGGDDMLDDELGGYITDGGNVVYTSPEYAEKHKEIR